MTQVTGTGQECPQRSIFTGAIHSHWVRVGILVGVYAVFSLLSCVLSFQLRFDFDVPTQWRLAQLSALVWFLPTKIFFLQLFGQFRGLLSYFRIPDLSRLVIALGLSSGMLLLANYSFSADYRVPRGVVLMDFVLSVLLLGGFRVGLRIYREKYATPEKRARRVVKRAAVLGAARNPPPAFSSTKARSDRSPRRGSR